MWIFKSEIDYLGYRINETDVTPTPQKADAVVSVLSRVIKLS